MATVHYFPRYSQKENMVTNNTLLLFSRLYQNSPEKFNRFINAILEKSGVELDTSVGFNQQERTNSGRIPDGVIKQESFKVVIETKLYGQENISQIKGHWNAFEGEDKQIFLWINKEKISESYYQKIIGELNQFNDANDTDIGFASTTFKEICYHFSEILQEYDLEMKALADDYEAFCSESGLLDHADSKIRVVLTSNTLEKNLKYNLYFQPRDRGYQTTKYIGLYQNKAVRAIGEISCIVDAQYDADRDQFALLEVVEGNLTADLRENIKQFTIEAKEKFGYPKGEARRFFAVDSYVKTDYKKLSKGGLMGNRYIHLSNVEGFREEMTTDKVARLLDGEVWDIK